MFRRAGKYIGDTLTKLSIETAAGLVATMIGSAIMTWWISADPRFPVESRPAIAIWFLIVALALGLLWVLIALGVRYFRAPGPATAANPDKSPSELDGEYEGAHYDLMLFAVDHVLPTIDTQISLQDKLVRLICDNKLLVEIVKDGLRKNAKLEDFPSGYDVLLGLYDSPPSYIPFKLMVDSIETVELHYKKLLYQGIDLSESANIDIADHTELVEIWETWRKKHNALIAAYESIKRNPKCGKLFRPLRASRWGGQVSQVVSRSEQSEP